MASLAEVDDFLSQKRIAFVGLSRHPEDFSHTVYKRFAEQGTELVPVHPRARELEGQRVFAHVSDIQPPVDGVYVMTPAAHSAEVVGDALAAGVRRIWLHRGVGPGAVSEEAVALCEEAGVKLIDGQCPMMFFADASFGHRVHRFFMKLGGRLPNQGRQERDAGGR